MGLYVSLACLEEKLWPIEHMMEKCYIMEHNICMQYAEPFTTYISIEGKFLI